MENWSTRRLLDYLIVFGVCALCIAQLHFAISSSASSTTTDEAKTFLPKGNAPSQPFQSHWDSSTNGGAFGGTNISATSDDQLNKIVSTLDTADKIKSNEIAADVLMAEERLASEILERHELTTKDDANKKLDDNRRINDKNNDTKTIQQLLFRPGTLRVSSVVALRHCYANVTIYQHHFRRVNRVSISQHYGLLYAMIPKSGSSTARLMMKTKFNGTEHRLAARQYSNEHHKNLTVFTFARDPLSRFFASYDEAFSRTGPWQKGYQHKRHPFPYLHESFPTYQDYEDVFCPPATRSHRRDCTHRATQENGTLAARLTRFVVDWDGAVPFDDHLHLQVPLLSDPATGRAVRVDEIYNTSAAPAGWRHLAQTRGVDLGDGVLHVKTHPRRFDVKLISNETKRRICQLALLDYCCLNLPLPPACSGLYCKLSYSDSNADDGKIQIEPLSHPQS